MGDRMRFGARTVELSSLGKVLYPEAGYTKGDVVDHYQKVATHMLRHIRNRPVTMQRFPDGISEEGFYQKEVPGSFPDWTPRARVTLRDGSEQDQVLVDGRSVLALLAQRAVLTMHVWTSREPRLERPDRVVFDLDPADEASFASARSAAERLRERLGSVGLSSHPLLTGSSGVQVWVPIRRGPGFDEVRAFARTVVESLAQESPDELTTEVRKAKRRGRLFLDVARNASGQTVVAPYSLRALPGAPVATPLAWDELSRVDGSRHYTLRSLPRRMAQRDDPWKGMGRHAADLERARRAWKRLHG